MSLSNNLAEASIELEDAVQSMLTFLVTAAEDGNDQDGHYLHFDDGNDNDNDNANGNTYGRAIEIDHELQSFNGDDFDNDNANDDDVDGDGDGGDGDGDDIDQSLIRNNRRQRRQRTSRKRQRLRQRQRQRQRQCNTYERKRGLRRIQRALDSFEEAMDAIHHRHQSQNQSQSQHGESHNDDNHDNNSSSSQIQFQLRSSSSSSSISTTMLTLNESILNILIEILTEIPKTLQVSSSTLSSSSTSSSSSSSSSLLLLLLDQNQLYNQEVATRTCSIIEKYAVLPLHSTVIDKLLDRIAIILSMEASSVSATATAAAATCSSSNSTSNTNSNSITTGRKGSKRGGGEYSQNYSSSTCTRPFSGQAFFLNMIQIVNTSLLAKDQQLQQLQQLQEESDEQDVVQMNKHSTGRKRNEFLLEQRQQHHQQQQLQQDEHEQELEQEQEQGQENYFPCDEDSYCNSIGSRTDNENKNNNVSSSSSSSSWASPSRKLLFLLDANETIALTQLLIPLSLKHLTHSWEFIVRMTTSTDVNVGVDVDVDVDDVVAPSHNMGMSNNMGSQNQIIAIDDDDDDDDDDVNNNDDDIENDDDEGDNHNRNYTTTPNQMSIDLEEEQTDGKREGERVYHHQDSDNDIEQDDEQDDEQDEQEEEAYKEEKDIQQESEVQLRVLLGYLFRHLSALIEGNDHNQNDCNPHMSISLEDSLYQLFHSAPTNSNVQHHGYSQSSYNNNERRLLVEDYIDLVTSFLIESIEYAIDVMDSASHYLRKLISRGKAPALAPIEEKNSGNHHCEGVVKGDVHTVRRYVKDTIRHCSIAIGMIEILYEDIGLQKYFVSSSLVPSLSATGSNDSHLMSLYKSYATFVASFCTDELLHGTFCWSTTQDVEAVGALFDSADNVLFRLSKVISSIKKGERDGNNGSVVYDREQYDYSTKMSSSVYGSNKRRRKDGRINGGNVHFLDTATTVAFLRAFHSRKNGCSHTEDYRADESVLDSAVDDVSLILQRVHGQHGTSPNENDFKSASETSNLIHACALSTLILSDFNNDNRQMNNGTRCNNQVSEKQLLSSFLSPLMKERPQDNDEETKGVLDPLNPWSYLLSTKISEIAPWIKESSNNMGGADEHVPVTVSTSSASSVSDLKSNIASISSGKSSDIQGCNSSSQKVISKNNTSIDYLHTISTFVRAVPSAHETI